MRYVVPLILFSGAAIWQQYEIGANKYRTVSVEPVPDSRTREPRNPAFGIALQPGIILGDLFSDYVSAEFRYLYHDGHGFLQAPAVKADIQGQSDALTMEALFHFKKREQRWRPFLAGGAGAKEYIVAGPERSPSRFRRLPSSRRTMCGKSSSAWAAV
jgi:hypothetical protein